MRAFVLPTTVDGMLVANVSLKEVAKLEFLDFRANLDAEELHNLMESIRRYGLLQPIVVRRSRGRGLKEAGAGYDLVCGYRRCEALRRLGLHTAPAVVMELEDREAFEVSLIENVQRENLDPIEEGEAFKSYVTNFGRGSVTKLAKRIGKSEEYVSHRMLLLGLPKPLRERISSRLLNPSHATELVWLDDQKAQLALSDEISRHNLSLRQVRAVVKMIRNSGLAARDAVANVLSSGTAKHGRTTAEYGPDPWPETSETGALDENMQTLERMKLHVRTCLAGVDLLIEKTDSSLQVYSVLAHERWAVHSILDDLIKAEIEYRKRGTVDHVIQYAASRPPSTA